MIAAESSSTRYAEDEQVLCRIGDKWTRHAKGEAPHGFVFSTRNHGLILVNRWCVGIIAADFNGYGIAGL
jgi:hypothetical protein